MSCIFVLASGSDVCSQTCVCISRDFMHERYISATWSLLIRRWLASCRFIYKWVCMVKPLCVCCAHLCLKLTSSSLFRVVLFTSPNAMPAFRAANVWKEKKEILRKSQSEGEWQRQCSGTEQMLQGKNLLC